MVTSNWQEWQVPEHFLSMIVAGMLTIVQQAPLPKQARLSPPQPAIAGAPSLLRSSFITRMDGEFASMDANKDGSLSKTELEAHQRRIALAAATRQAQARFTQIDADRNGQISPAEFSKASVGTAAPVDASQVMARLDANADSKVTSLEHRVLTLATFDRIDADKDGVLTPAEQQAGGLAR